MAPWNIILNFFIKNDCYIDYWSSITWGNYGFNDYLPYFVATVLLELPVYAFFLSRILKTKKFLIANLAMNLTTHPIIFFVFPFVLSKFNTPYLIYLMIAETFAPVVEALILKYVFKISTGRAFTAAIIANLFSWSVGTYLF